MRVLPVFFLCASLARPQPALRGFPPEQAKKQTDWETQYRGLPQARRIGAYLTRMAALPHMAGTPGSKAVAEYAYQQMREWGLDAKIERFEGYLPYPVSRTLELRTSPVFRAKLQEPAIAEDPQTRQPGQVPTFNAYSAAGTVTAPVVYANYGLPADYEQLRRRGIDVRGKIVLVRYGRSWRGVKPKVAAENGAAACLIYSDPREDGYYAGDVYPRGPYRPEEGVQRGSVMDMAVHSGDPLSPGWASERGSRRLTPAESTILMKIPVMPISAADARPLLENMSGPTAPESWRGALPITYHLGPSRAQAYFKLEFDAQTRPLYNVIGTIPGAEEPDQWVIYGNHHDAWVNGANDPVSGASALLETARSLTKLHRSGWRPRRTIKLALWDGEEFGLIGSTEWVEKHADELRTKCIAYLNSDSTGKGPLSAAGTPALGVFLSEVLRDVQDPLSGKSLLQGQRPARTDTGADATPSPQAWRLMPLGAGSDYVSFAHFLGIPSLNLGFSSGDSSGVYHSMYDTVAWYTKFSDGDFTYGRTFSELTGLLLMRLADAPLLPFDFEPTLRSVQNSVREVQSEAGTEADKLDLSEVQAELEKLHTSAAGWSQQVQAVDRWAKSPSAKLERINQVLFHAERALTLPDGLPGRPWYKHQLSAPGRYTGYGAKTLPGIREAVEAKRWSEANEQAKQVAKALRAYTAEIDRATRLLSGGE